MNLFNFIRKKKDINLYEAFRSVVNEGNEVIISTEREGVKRIYREFSLGAKEKKLLAKSVPLLFKGMRKKSRDIFRSQIRER